MSAKNYDFNKKLFNEGGIAYADIPNIGEDVPKTLAQSLSAFLGTETKGNTAKIYGWHKDLRNEHQLTLDDSDKEDLKKIIETSERLYIFIKGQLLDVLNS